MAKGWSDNNVTDFHAYSSDISSRQANITRYLNVSIIVVNVSLDTVRIDRVNLEQLVY